MNSELCIHKLSEDSPKIEITKYSNFYTVEIEYNPGYTIKIFLYSEQQIVAFKNNFLWAFENPTDVR